jgi:hypothetical protein
MDQDSIIRYVADTFAGVDILSPTDGVGAGDTFFIYDPERNLDVKQRFPFATMVTKNYGDFDCASNLDRPGVFRLNIGVSKDTYRSLFGPPPSPPGEAGIVDTGHDFAALDQLMPHPVYGHLAWVCVLNPSDATFLTVRPLLAEAYDRAVSRQARRVARD